MPSPFTHLKLAERVILDPELPEAHRSLLSENRGAYLFGHTAPDFVSRAGRSREESHFFTVPMKDKRPAHLRILERYRGLQPESISDSGTTSFIAGYFCHLWVDQLWISNIFEPLFGAEVERGTFQERLIDHNLLRAHIDIRDETSLTPQVPAHLAELNPGAWLPFASPQELHDWLEHLTEQLHPGGQSKTIEVFSRKSGIPSSMFVNRLTSEQGMRDNVFQHLPDGLLVEFGRHAIDACRELTSWYLGGAKTDDVPVNRPFREGMILETNPRSEAHHAID